MDVAAAVLSFGEYGIDIDVFAIDSEGYLNRRRIYVPDQLPPVNYWSDWNERWSAPSGGPLAGAAITTRPGIDPRRDVFAVDPGVGGIAHRFYQDTIGDWSSWNEWPRPNGNNIVDVAAAGGEPNAINVFAIDSDGYINRRYLNDYDSGQWSRWIELGPAPSGGNLAAAAVTPRADTDPRLDVFAVDQGTGKLVHRFYKTSLAMQDVDEAHDYAGETYDYFKNTHGQDSFDGYGGKMRSSANTCQGWYNAFYSDAIFYADEGQYRPGTIYGDSMAKRDIVAHEWTHGVNAFSADLEYEWQSGALSESFSDVFGAMVDRDDWEMGEGSGLGAIRDLADPPRFGQPDHVDDWSCQTSDSYGVHTNSGITNKAYYLIATAISKGKSEQIFYRTLTRYLSQNSSLEDARAAAIQSAADIYGAGSAEYNQVVAGFNAVGLDGLWQPPPKGSTEEECEVLPPCDCGTECVMFGNSLSKDGPSAFKVLATLYRARSELGSKSAAGSFYLPLYSKHMKRVSELLVKDRWLRAESASVLQQVTPGLTKLMDGDGDEVSVSSKLLKQGNKILVRFADNDRANGGAALSKLVERERKALDLMHYEGMTFKEGWAELNSHASKRQKR